MASTTQKPQETEMADPIEPPPTELPVAMGMSPATNELAEACVAANRNQVDASHFFAQLACSSLERIAIALEELASQGRAK